MEVYAGSGEPLHYTVLAYTGPGRSFVTAEPSYEAGMRAAATSGAKVVKVPLTADFAHDDLMVRCRRHGVRGGLKQIEQRFGITRRIVGLTGRDAPRLWHEYDTNGDEHALATLLEYNREDVVNLALLEHRLDDAPAPDIHPAVQVWR